MTANDWRVALFVAVLSLADPGANAAPSSYFVLANGALSADALTSIERAVPPPDAAGSRGAANLATGKLEASAFYWDFVGDGIGANAEFGDTLTVMGVIEPTIVTLNLHVTGDYYGVGDGLALIAYGNGGFDCSASDCDFTGQTLDSQRTLWRRNGDGSIDRTIKLEIPISPIDSTFSVVGYLNSDIEYGAGDYRAFVSLALPEGLSFVSASGVFLSPVPEPSSYALLCAGLLATAFSVKVRRTGSRAG